MPKNTKEEKKLDLIAKEYEKVKKIFASKNQDFLELNDELFQRAAFMAVTLKEMEGIINREGTIRVGTNGNGFTTCSEHPAQKSYNTMMKNYSGVMIKLNGFLETTNTTNGGDEFDEF